MLSPSLQSKSAGMDIFLFVALPYMALVLAILGGIYRFHKARYTYSSLSSQILENRNLFWGSVPWHYGITLILLAHLFAALFPGAAGFSWWRDPAAGAGIDGDGAGIFTLFGLVVLIVRRLPRIAGAGSHLLYGWRASVRPPGSSGHRRAYRDLQPLGRRVVPAYGRSLVLVAGCSAPDMSTVADLPPFVKLHFVTGSLSFFCFRSAALSIWSCFRSATLAAPSGGDLESPPTARSYLECSSMSEKTLVEASPAEIREDGDF